MVNDQIRSLLPDAIRVLQQHRVVKAYLFGSVLTERFNSGSDIDILVSFDTRYFDGYTENYYDMIERLSQVFGHPVDVTPETQIQNPVFKRIVEQTRLQIYG